MKKLFQIFSTIIKVLITPFFYFSTIICFEFLSTWLTQNYSETIEGTAVMVFIIGPIGLLLLSIPSLISLKLIDKLSLVKKDNFLVLWGIFMACILYTILYFFAGLLEIFYYIF